MPATLADIQAKYGEGVYPLYKDQMHEPYMENASGNGYLGVVMYDEVDDKVQCSVCGKWYKRISQQHIQKCTEFQNVFEYKDHFGIERKTPLCAVGYSKIQSAKFVQYNKTAPKVPKLVRAEQAKMSLRVRTAKPNSSIQHKNRFGLCDAQIASRLEVIRSVTNREITSKDVNRYDPKLYKYMQNKWGNYDTACQQLGIVAYGKSNRITDVGLIGKLRVFVMEKKRMPTKEDFQKYLGPCIDIFGSWDRAKLMAGLDQLVHEVKQGDND